MSEKLSNDEHYTGFFIEWIEEWSQFFQSCNWYTFHPVQIEFEDERNMGGCECTIVFLGIGFRARWNYRRTEQVDRIVRQIEELHADDL